jgi:hypothetical protein
VTAAPRNMNCDMDEGRTRSPTLRSIGITPMRLPGSADQMTLVAGKRTTGLLCAAVTAIRRSIPGQVRGAGTGRQISGITVAAHTRGRNGSMPQRQCVLQDK